jgi:hypothetical protein
MTVGNVSVRTKRAVSLAGAIDDALSGSRSIALTLKPRSWAEWEKIPVIPSSEKAEK